MGMIGVSKETATEKMGRVLRVPKSIAEAFLRMLIEIVYVFASVSVLALQLSSAQTKLRPMLKKISSAFVNS